MLRAARTAGLRKARELGAAWYAFCDADDLYHPALLDTLYTAALNSGLPLACCRYDTFSDTAPQNITAPSGCKILRSPAHLDALLHDHAVDYGLWNKLYSADLLTEDMLDNGLAYNEDLLANWRAFLCYGVRFLRFRGLPLPPARRQRQPPRPAAPEHCRPAARRRRDPRQRTARNAAERERVLL